MSYSLIKMSISLKSVPEILVVSQSRSGIDGIASQAKRLGPWRLRFCRPKDQRFSALLENKNLRGAIVEPDPDIIQVLLNAQIPVVSIFGEVKRRACPSVGFNEFAIGEMAAMHLMRIGLRNLLWSGVSHPFSRQREAGFLDAVTRAGGQLVSKRWTWVNGTTENIGAWLQQQALPMGIGTCSDSMADLVMTALEQGGIQVPAQAAVVGVDNNELLCELSLQSISSVDRNEQQIGETAASLLAQMMNGKKISLEPICISPRFVVERNSSLMGSVGDPQLSKVVAYLRTHARKPIDIHTLVHLSGYSRATLFRKFQEQYGCSPAQMIRQHRLEIARSLLLDTDQKLTDIALRSGFASASHFSKCFQTAYQQSPGQYRQRNY